MKHPIQRTLVALSAVAFLLPTLASAADSKGRWINDGMGRATRDGHGSTCVSSGGDDHAFANPDCQGGTGDAQKASPAAPPNGTKPSSRTAGTSGPAKEGGTSTIYVEAPKEQPNAGPGSGQPLVRDAKGNAVRDGQARACVRDSRGVPGSDCDLSGAAAAGTEEGLAKRIQMPPSEAQRPEPATPPSPGAATPAGKPAPRAGTDESAAVFPENRQSLDAAPAVAPVIAGTADDNGDGAATSELAEDDTDQDDTTASGDDAIDDGDTIGLPVMDDEGDVQAVSPADDPAYAPGSVEITDRSPGVPGPSTATREAAPVIDNRLPEFPVTRYTADDAKTPAAAPADAGKPAASPAKLLRKSLQIDKTGLFDSNSARLRGKLIPELDEVVSVLKSAADYGKVTITGHTDRMGSGKLNRRLSQRRAEAVRGYLVARGLDPARISATGKGSAEPVTAASACAHLAKPAMRECLAPDRRVEIEATATPPQ
ncbi:MAG: OmpA family protein [Betaproteobacteria bacterium]|nr:OmpA family protein [Betaproteobacteria bacterium]